MCLLSKIKLLLCNVIGKKRIYKHYEKKCRNTKSNKKTVDKVSYYWDYENYENLNEEYFGDPVYMPFEFTEIPVPREYDTILKKYYGDNYLCPQIKQSGHQLTSGDMIIDTERSYQDILNQMNNNSNINQMQLFQMYNQMNNTQLMNRGMNNNMNMNMNFII